ncbi:MAG: hypothetical protein ACYDG2_16110 [Ruminiclostridium sp.]
MGLVERKPNTRAVYIDALVSKVEELKIKLKSFYSLISKTKQKDIVKDFEREAEKLEQLESFFITEEGKERLDKKSKVDIFYWDLLSQTKAEYNRFRNQKISKAHTRDSMKRIALVRGVNKLRMATSSYSNMGAEGFKIGGSENAIFSISAKCTNRHLMIIDAVATEFKLGLENGKYDVYSSILDEYVFEHAWEAEMIWNHVKQIHDKDKVISVTLNNGRIRDICGISLKSKEIDKLINEIMEISVDAHFCAYISYDEGCYEHRLKNQFKSKIFDCDILEAKDIRGNKILEYVFYLNTTAFGCFLINNIIGNYFDYVSPVLYQLSGFAQNIFKKIVSDSYSKFQIKERHLFNAINSFDRNNTKIRYRVQAALDELKESGFIKSYKVLEGKDDLVYHINKYSKKKTKNTKGKYGVGGRRKSKGG